MALFKRIFVLALAALLCLALATCAKKPDASVDVPSSLPAASSPSQAQSVPVPSSAPQNQPNNLVQLPPLPLAEGVNALTGLAAPEGMLSGQRPVAVMVANNQRALPQRGLAPADVIVEMLTEGGITRLMAMYADYRALPQVGPVRSTRDQFVQMAMPVAAIQSHIGTSVYARNLLDVSAIKDVNGLFLGSTAFWFDELRTLPKLNAKPNEYCWYTDAALLWSGMEFLDVYTTGEVRQMFNFTDDAAANTQAANAIDVVYSAGSYSGFAYNAETQVYGKSIFGQPHTDEDGTPLGFTNVILLNCNISLKPDGMCTEFDFSGGSGLYFTKGGVQEVVWQKGEPNQPLRLLNAAGEEIAVQRGKSYIGFVPVSGGAVNYAQ